MTITAGANITADSGILSNREFSKHPAFILLNCCYTLLIGSTAYIFLFDEERQNYQNEYDSQSALTAWRTIQRLRSENSEKNVSSKLTTSYINFAVGIGAGAILTGVTSGFAWITARGIMDNFQATTNH